LASSCAAATAGPAELFVEMTTRTLETDEDAVARAAVQMAVEGGWNGRNKPRKQFTNAYLIDGTRVLLGMKKRGFGEGKLNGFGGKVQPDETVCEAALREMEEESGVRLLDATLAGVLLYDYPLKDTTMEVYFYRATSFKGRIGETDEMAPLWVERAGIDYSTMWADDPWWMDKMFELDLTRSAFIGWFNFTEDMARVVQCQVKDVSKP
jgi:8-oxo-dGTP pyrophosphatase MutT (NUDIX family)